MNFPDMVNALYKFVGNLGILDYILLTLILSGLCVIAWNYRIQTKINRIHKRLNALNDRIFNYFLIDPLTELYNYKFFVRRLKEEINKTQRKKISVSLIKLDIKLFNNINIIYGIPEGDKVLTEFAVFLKETSRSCDVVARLKDEEFAILLDHTGKKEALNLAKRIKDTLRLRAFGKKDKITFQVSMGVVTLPEDGTSEIALLSLLDRCVNRSKENGRTITTPQDFNYTGNDGLLGIDTQNIHELRNRICVLEGLLGKTILESIIAFANALKAKDLYTADHTTKTVRIALAIGKRLKLSRKQLQTLKHASMLHDLGKVGIPERILTKPGKLTKEEFEEIKKHPIIGAEILRPLHELTEIIPPILYHHERIDGEGYPYGLESNKIPIEAKIVAIADTFQALTSNRPYRKAFSQQKAISILEDESGTHFDPQIVETFKDALGTMDSESGR